MPPNCTVYGYVKDLPLYLFAADVALAPYPSSARSGGARNKVLEYMACGVPVISTLEGMRGIQGAVPNVHFLLADETPIGFLDSISKASSNQNLKTIASDGANLASGNFSWESAGEKLDRVLRNL